MEKQGQDEVPVQSTIAKDIVTSVEVEDAGKEDLFSEQVVNTPVIKES